jgi:hypothetical protein
MGAPFFWCKFLHCCNFFKFVANSMNFKTKLEFFKKNSQKHPIRISRFLSMVQVGSQKKPLPTTLRACRWGPFPSLTSCGRSCECARLPSFEPTIQWRSLGDSPAHYTSSWFRYLVHDTRRNTLWFATRDSVVNLFWICDEERKPIFTAVVELIGVSLPFASPRNFALIDVCKY